MVGLVAPRNPPPPLGPVTCQGTVRWGLAGRSKKKLEVVTKELFDLYGAGNEVRLRARKVTAVGGAGWARARATLGPTPGCGALSGRAWPVSMPEQARQPMPSACGAPGPCSRRRRSRRGRPGRCIDAGTPLVCRTSP